MELYERLEVLNRQLDEALRTYRQNGIALAEAERSYKEAVTKEALILRDKGTASTLINLIIYGSASVSELRFERDCAEAIYRANEEAINVKKLQIRLIEGQLNREWSSGGIHG